MNLIYRLCWNRSLGQWVPASELARSRRRGATCRRIAGRGLVRSLLWMSLGLAGLAQAGTHPTGGQIVAGSGQIQQSGDTTTIRQDSQLLSLNWQNFDIGTGQTVQFLQPGADSIAVNRILGNTASEIQGHLKANGQVWLINPNGVLFGRDAQVNVGGLVASTLAVDDSTIGSDDVRFAGNGKGEVVNRGRITASRGGYVALLGNHVSNQGVIRARLGTVALGAGTAVTLTFADHHLVHLQVNENTVRSLVDNRQLIVADGGRVLMTAGARDSLVASAVNNSGTVQARSVREHNGTITLLGGMQAGTVNVGGTLDASAPDGGDGGQIETSAAHFELARDVHITAAAANGRAGTWLVDPVDLTIDADAASTISSTLDGGTNVTEQTTAGSAGGEGTQSPGDGDINVNEPISWNSAATLTLDAYHDINVNADISGDGGIVLTAPNGALTIASGGSLSADGGATLTADTFVNNASPSALGPNWLLYTTSPAGNVLGGLAPDFIQYDAAPGSTLADTGNGLIYSVAPTLHIGGLKGVAEKTYDNTSAASFAGANFDASGLLGGDQIASASGGTYASVNVGSGIAVTSPGEIGDFVIANNGVPVYGYALGGAPVSGNIGKISQRELTMTIVNTPTKTYNGTTTATLTSINYHLSGLVDGQSISFAQPSEVVYAGADAGSQTVTATFLDSNFKPGAGTRLSNYKLPVTASGPGMINRAPVELTGLFATDKTYDGTVVDELDIADVGIFGVITDDDGSVQLDSDEATGTFDSANAGKWSVTVSGFSLTGSQAGNYQLVAPTNLTASITPKSISIEGVTAQNRTYNATDVATINVGGASLDGLVELDQGNITLVTGGASAHFDDPNVGTGKAVSTDGFTLTGAGSANYILAPLNDLTADITPAPLTINITGNPTRLYNGSNVAALGSDDVTITGLQGSDKVMWMQNADATYASVNASASGGNLITATVEWSDFDPADGTLLSNYSIPEKIKGAGTISPIKLTWSLVGNPTKTYDTSTAASLVPGNYQIHGFLAGEGATVTQTEGNYASADAGQWLVTVNLAESDFSPVGDTVLGNYVFPDLMTGIGTIVPAPIKGSIYAALDGPTKIYDGTTSATLTPSDFVLTGFFDDDGATVSQTVGTFSNKNVGRRAVSATLSPSDFTATGSTNLSNYKLPIAAYGTGTITQATLTASIVGSPTKVYDGTSYMVLTPANYALSGFASGEGAQIKPASSILFASKNVGTQDVTADLAASSYVANDGTLLSNYVLATTATGTGEITPAPLYVTGVVAQDRVYDTTTAAVLNSVGAALTGLVSGDVGSVSLTAGTAGTFAQADVGNAIGVTASGFSISGSEAGNYTLYQPSGLAADITQKGLSIIGLTALDREYDGTTAVALGGSASLQGLDGVYAADAANVSVDLSGASGSTRSANVGTWTVITTGIALSGSKANNYSVSATNDLAIDITPRELTVAIIGNPEKPYDGTDSVTLDADDYSLTGFVDGESGSVQQSATAGYDDVNAGEDIGLHSTLEPSDFVAGPGTSLSNYKLPTEATGTLGTITKAIINLRASRPYNAQNDADAILFTSGGRINGVNGENLTLTGSGTVSSKNVGSYTGLNFDHAGLTLGDGDGDGKAINYTLDGGIDWLTITPKALTAVFTAEDKTYDGNDIATLTAAATLSGLIGTDDVTLVDPTIAHFSDKNAGTGKKITGDMSISGSDAGNYTFSQGTATAAINAKHITVGVTAEDRQYDGTTKATVNLTSGGVIGGDNVTFKPQADGANFDDKNVGTGKTVTVEGIAASGSDAGNYALDNTSATTTADITPHVLDLVGTRIYDGTTTADAGTFGGGTVQGVLGETLTLSGSHTVSKNAGTYTWDDGGGLSLGDGGSGGLASNYTLVGGTETYTITRRALTATFDANDKTYDGTRAAVTQNAQLVAAGGSATSGLVAGDNVSLTNPTAGKFDDKNVGTGKTVTGAMAITGDDAGNYLFTNGTATADITRRTITVDANGKDKVYDGNTTDPGLTLSSSGKVAGDDLSFSSGSVAFDDKDVGTRTVTVTGITATGDDAGNYTLDNTSATDTADITPYVLDLTGTRVYDGSTDADAALFGTNGALDGVAGETIGLAGTGHVADKNVVRDGNGDPIARTITDLGTFTLSDGDNGGLASNYTLIGGTDTLVITPKTLGATATVANRTYDATRIIALDGASLVGLIGGDNVTLGNASQGTFANKNVGDAKAITTAMTISGGDAGNYAFTTLTGLTADVTPLAITVDAAVDNKVYDATTAAMGTVLTSSGVLSGDVLDFHYGTATFADANAADNKDVTVDGITKSGADAGNYTINATAGTTADITQKVLDLSGTRIYDGTTGADAGAFGTDGLLQTGIGSQTLVLTGSGTVGDKNVDISKTVSLGSLALTDGTDGNGGLASNYTLVGGTDTLTITPLAITVDATVGDKTYDATTAATVTSLTSGGVLSGDKLTFTHGTATFADANAADGKTVTVGGITRSGDDAGNYTINTTATTTANITQKVLDLSGTRVYDRTTGADADAFGTGGVLETGIGSQTLVLTGSGTVGDKNVDTNKTVSLGSLALTDGTDGNGGLASNYTLVGGTDTLTITAKQINAAALAQDKVYDGDNLVDIDTLDSAGVLGGDEVIFDYDSATFADANAAAGKTVTVAGVNMSGEDALNYALNDTTVTATADITQKVLDLSGTRIYDGTTGADAGAFGTDGVLETGIGSQTLVLAGIGTVGDKNVDTNKTVSLGSLALTDGTDGNGGLASNYTLIGGTDTLTITPLAIKVDATVDNKVYDATTAATVASLTSGGVLSGDKLTFTHGTATFADANAADGKTVTVGGITRSGDDAANYTINTTANTTADITPVVLDLSGTRIYDGTTGADADAFGTGGLLETGIGSQTLVLTGTGAVGDKNVDTNKTVSLGSLALTDGNDGNGGLAQNYTLVGGTDTLTITPLAIDVQADAQDRIYDATTGAMATLASSDVLSGDTVSFDYATATFADADAADGKTVTVDGITRSGADAANYTLNSTKVTATADITPYVLDLAGTRVYDGGTDADADLFGAGGVLTGTAGQTLQLTGSGQVADKNVDTNKALTSLGSLKLLDGGNGGLAQNYTLVGGTDTLTITPLAIDVSADAQDKIYDAGTTAGIDALSSSGVLTGDTVTFDYGSAVFADANADTGKMVTVSGLTRSGADAANYMLNSTTVTTTADITPYVLDLAGTRVYDGGTEADAGLFGAGGVLTGTAGQTLQLTGSGQVADKNVGTNKAFTSLGSLKLLDGGNGGLAQNYTLVGGTDTLTITPLAIDVSADAQDKIYDAGTAAGIDALSSSGVLTGDTVTFDYGSAVFADANADTGKTVTVSGLTRSGADAANYTLNSATVTTTAAITPYVLDLTGTRVYDGSTDADAELFGSHGVLTGVNGETLSLSGTGEIADKNVGTHKPFASMGWAGLTLTGNGSALASNYTLAGGNDWVTITPATLRVVDTRALDRLYDGTLVATLSGATLSGLFGSDDVTLGHAASGLFTDANVGTGKTVATAMTITGNDAGNYVLRQPTGLAADVTPRPVTVIATGTDKMFDGNARDRVTLAGVGVLPADEVGFSHQTASFTDSNVADDKTVTVTGIRLTGADATNYVLVNPVATTTASITGARPSAFGVDDGLLAYLQDPLRATAIATPYGLAAGYGVGPYTGNKKMRHRPVERNRARSDFTSGMALKVIDGGVRMPIRAMP